MELIDGRDAVVVWVIVVPLIAFCVEEEHVFGEVVVVVDDVSGEGDGPCQEQLARDFSSEIDLFFSAQLTLGRHFLLCLYSMRQ